MPIQSATGFSAQYLNEPQSFPPGIYCRRCGHSEPMYMDRMAARVLGSEQKELPCCGDKHCGCITHMVETFEVTQ